MAGCESYNFWFPKSGKKMKCPVWCLRNCWNSWVVSGFLSSWNIWLTVRLLLNKHMFQVSKKDNRTMITVTNFDKIRCSIAFTLFSYASKANCHKLLKVLHAFWLFIRSYRIYRISLKLSNFKEHERSLATNKYLFQVDDWDVNAMSMEVVLVALNRYLLSNFPRSVSLFFPIYLRQCFI